MSSNLLKTKPIICIFEYLWWILSVSYLHLLCSRPIVQLSVAGRNPLDPFCYRERQQLRWSNFRVETQAGARYSYVDAKLISCPLPPHLKRAWLKNWHLSASAIPPTPNEIKVFFLGFSKCIRYQLSLKT